VAKILEAFLHNQHISSSQTLQHPPQPNSVILKMEVTSCSSTSEQTHYTTWCKGQEGHHLINTCHENLKTYILVPIYQSTWHYIPQCSDQGVLTWLRYTEIK
jgi:hypothetical protein